MHRATLRLHFVDAATALRAARSIAADNDASTTGKPDDKVLMLNVTGQTVLGLLRSIEDALTCLRAAGLEPDATT